MENNDDYFELKVILWLILFLVFGIIIITCKPGDSDIVMTVNGPEPAGKLCITLEHEHILVDFIGADSTGYFRWNRDSVAKAIIPLLEQAKSRGLNTFIECTPQFLGRDPWLLKELSAKTGIIFVTNTGYYGSGANKYLPASFYLESDKTLAEKWITEFENGIEGSGVRPGFIKIAVENDSVISHQHQKIVRAAGLAHLRTGMPIASHTGPGHLARGQADILDSMGVDLTAFMWVHAQRGTINEMTELAERGVWISLDNFRYRPGLKSGERNSKEWYAGIITELKDAGFLNKILISHDSGWYEPGKPGGGNISGYTELFDFLLPELRNSGFTQKELDQLLVKNPAKAYSIRNTNK
jgi:phosphotriesterase-related protein